MPRTRTRPENKDPCSICGETIKYKCDLARHYLLHAPNKEDLKNRCPWPNCTFKTLQKSNVKAHIRRTHRKKVGLCSVEPSCTFSALDRQSADRHKDLDDTEHEALSPVIPDAPCLNTIPDVTEATTSFSADSCQDGFTSVDRDLGGMLLFAVMPPNAEPVSVPSYQLLSWEDYCKIKQYLAEMGYNDAVPPNSQSTSASYKYGRKYAPRSKLASCSIPGWVQPSDNPVHYNTYEQQQAAAQQPPILPESSWGYIPEYMPPSPSSSSSGASSFGDYFPGYDVPLDPFPSSLGDLPPNYGVPLEAFPPYPSGLDLNVAAPVYQYDEPWDLGLEYYGNGMPGASNLDAIPTQCF